MKILKHLCVPVTKVQAHLLSTFSIELIAIVLTVNRCARCLVDCGLQQKQHNLVTMYLKMDLKSDFFYFFQTICFWKAETKLGMNQLEFLGSEVI